MEGAGPLEWRDGVCARRLPVLGVCAFSARPVCSVGVVPVRDSFSTLLALTC